MIDLVKNGSQRVGVIGDVHCEDRLLETALDYLRDQTSDLILCTGDIADGSGAIDHCCELLRSNAVIVVKGNHDRWLLTGQLRDLDEATVPESVGAKTKNYLRTLPATVELQTVDGVILLCHGLGENDMAGIRPDDFGYALEVNLELQDLSNHGRYRYIINGHTHRRMVRSIGSITVINVGTLKRDHDPCFALIDFATKVVNFFQFGPSGKVVPVDEIRFS